MNRAKWWTGLMVVLALAMTGMMPSRAAKETVGGVTWSYSVSGGKATVTGAKPVKGKVTIPSSLGGCPVTSIGRLAFDSSTNMTTLVIPNTVLNIQERAFQYCGMKTLKLGNGVTNIADYAFDWCVSLTNLVIPDSVRHIGDYAFHDAFDLVSLKLGKNVESIGAYAFTSCESLKKVAIPDSVKSIGMAAFIRCYALTDFSTGNGLTNVTGFSNCKNLQHVTIGSNVRSIDDGAFFSCSSLKTLSIPDNVKSVGTGAFEYCYRLATLYVPASWEGTSILANAMVPESCKVVYVRLALASESRTFTAAAASGQKLAVTANVKWTAKSSAAWLTVKTASGSGNGTIKYDVAANPEASSRTGKITVKGGGLSRKFKVTQNGVTKQVTTFKGNGGTPATQKTTNTIGKAYATLPSAKWSGHALVGWFTKAEGGTQVKTNSTVTVAAKRTLYAHWTTKQVTTFKGNGGTPTSQKTTNTVGKTYGKLPKVTWENHVFLGWGTKATGGTLVTADSKVTAAAKRTLYAQWTDQQVTTFKGNNGTPSTQKTTNTMGKAYGQLPEAKRSGYALVGWFTKAEGGTQVKTNSTVTVAAKRTLYAHWTNKQVTTFKGNGGTPATQKTTNTIGKAYGKLPEVSWSNHVFQGWGTKAAGGTLVTADSLVTEAAKRTLYAVWKEDGGALPEIGSDSEVAGVMARAADRRLAAKIANVTAYEDFRRWVTGKGLDPEKVMESSHAWASYVLGADTLFENEPEIRLEGLSAGGNGTRASGSPSTLRIRVTVKDGGKTVSVDAAKVAALFAATANPVDWTGDARLVPSATLAGTDTDGTMTFDVKAGTAPASRVFLGIRE